MRTPATDQSTIHTSGHLTQVGRWCIAAGVVLLASVGGAVLAWIHVGEDGPKQKTPAYQEAPARVPDQKREGPVP